MLKANCFQKESINQHWVGGLLSSDTPYMGGDLNPPSVKPKVMHLLQAIMQKGTNVPKSTQCAQVEGELTGKQHIKSLSIILVIIIILSSLFVTC